MQTKYLRVTSAGYGNCLNSLCLLGVVYFLMLSADFFFCSIKDKFGVLSKMVLFCLETIMVIFTGQ